MNKITEEVKFLVEAYNNCDVEKEVFIKRIEDLKEVNTISKKAFDVMMILLKEEK